MANDHAETTSANRDGVQGERFRDWKAINNQQPIVSSTPLRVGGQYHLGMRCGGVSLEVTVPQGINDRILLLHLVDGATGDGGDWVDVRGEFSAQRHQYNQVEVRDSEGGRLMIDVVDVD